MSLLASSGIVTPWGVTEYVGSANFSTSSSGQTAIVAATAGYFIVVLAYQVVSANVVQVAFESGNGDVQCGPFTVGQYGGVVGPDSNGLFACNRGESLLIDLGSAVQTGGFVKYGLVRGR
jgi:hypothetical protein